MNIIKKILKFLSGFAVAFTCAGLMEFSPIFLLTLPVFLEGIGLMYDGMMKQDTNGSIFKLNSKGLLVQNPLKLDQVIVNVFKKDKVGNFLEDFIKFLSQLPVNNKNGKVEYKTVSHWFTLKRLMDLQDMGYIENLKYDVKYNGEKKSFFIENISMGNFSDPFKKKEKLDISFNLTGKKFDNPEIEDFIRNLSIRKSKVMHTNSSSYNEVVNENIDSNESDYSKEKEDLLKLRDYYLDIKLEQELKNEELSNDDENEITK